MTRNDRHIALGAIVTAAVALTAIIWLSVRQPATATADATADATASSADASRHPSSHRRSGQPIVYDATPSHSPESFPFDPNTADSTQLLRLGLQPWQVRNIYRYRARGGIYRRKEDFARLYGLTIKDYRRLEPYIRISADYLPASTLFAPHKTHASQTRDAAHNATTSQTCDTPYYTHKLKEGQHVVLNTADTAQLLSVPGIGNYYAREILRHGQWLGGYVSTDQLDEIEGFPQESKKYFIVQNPAPQKLNINRLTLPQLRRHPYINFYQAKAIVDYRRLRGPITSLQDLRLSPDFTPEAIRRLEPYVEY